jgi:hypothetical protein
LEEEGVSGAAIDDQMAARDSIREDARIAGGHNRVERAGGSERALVDLAQPAVRTRPGDQSATARVCALRTSAERQRFRPTEQHRAAHLEH